ncbi:MAG: UDP-N-acetylmuramate dehydrogenase [Tissierellales bacterium]|jgi:UDP-N-acetylmuramate dehydrogenase|nr:UDP-N-acetylmuramate dehydrogenase [Tissierellales bacterium]
MSHECFEDRLYDIIDGNYIYINEKMSKHTYFKIGGAADFMIEPRTEEELSKLIKLLNEFNKDYFVLGNGTNLLVSDKGIRDVVIKIGDAFEHIDIDGENIIAGAGCSLSEVAQSALANELTGFEFASGIPGAVGGALTMNAGAYGGEMKDIVKSVRCINSEGEIRVYDNEEMLFAYRNSRIQKQHLIALGAIFKLEKGDRDIIASRMQELNEKRRQKQPLDMPSAGSTFKRPDGDYASRLIEVSGLKGVSFRGAQVSAKHSGFVVNKNNATCSEVVQLIEFIQKVVKDQTGYDLEPEVKVIGEK